MRKMWLMAALGALWSSWTVTAAADDLTGSWSGPWYRGMTSGMMTLQIGANGTGVIQMTNLDNFTGDEVVLSDVEKDATSFRFSASGGGHGAFVAKTKLSDDGKTLKGKGEYDGFPIKFKLERR